MSINRVIIMGNLTRDVELRAAGSTQVAQIGMALNHKYKGGDGQVKEDVVFVDVEAWGKTAEIAAQYFVKGSRMFVEGRLKLDQWEDKTDGTKRSKIKVVADRIEFVDKKSDDAPAAASKTTTRKAPPTKSEMILEEDIPFSPYCW